MKIVIISPFQFSLNRGIERFSYSVGNALARLGHDIVLYSWRVQGQGPEWGAWHSKVKIRRVPFFKYYMRFFAPFFYRYWLTRDQPQKVVLNFLYHGEEKLPPQYSYLYVLNSPASQVLHRYEFICKTLNKFPDLNFVAVSKMVAEEAKPYVGIRAIFVIPNGVDTDKFKIELEKSIGDKLRLVTASALEERKGIQHVIRAIAHIKSPDLVYHIYGTGPYKQKIIDLIEDNKLQDKVFLYDPINNLEEVLPKYDIFCLLSKGEAFALAPIEAMACGLPILVSNFEPYNEYVKDTFGKMVNRNSIEEIQIAIIEIMLNYADMRKSAREASLKYDWNRIALMYDEILTK